MSRIEVQDLSLKFRLYHDKTLPIKDYLINLVRGRREKVYSDFWALRDLNLVIEEGQRVGIVGHNGAGKSSLLKTICQIYVAQKGGVKVEGRIAPLIEIGAGFHPEFTGRENIYLNSSILGFSKEEIAKIEPEIIEFTGLEEFIDTPIKYYSTGMSMKLAFAVATAVHPDILILDEMFAGGDETFREKAFARMHQFIDKANIMVLVSHETNLLLRLCNRVVWLDHGQVKMDGDPQEVIDAYIGAA